LDMKLDYKFLAHIKNECGCNEGWVSLIFLKVVWILVWSLMRRNEEDGGKREKAMRLGMTFL